MPPWQIFCWPFKVTSTVLCIVDEAGLGTALIVGCMSSKAGCHVDNIYSYKVC